MVCKSLLSAGLDILDSIKSYILLACYNLQDVYGHASFLLFETENVQNNFSLGRKKLISSI